MTCVDTSSSWIKSALCPLLLSPRFDPPCSRDPGTSGSPSRPDPFSLAAPRRPGAPPEPDEGRKALRNRTLGPRSSSLPRPEALRSARVNGPTRQGCVAARPPGSDALRGGWRQPGRRRRHGGQRPRSRQPLEVVALLASDLAGPPRSRRPPPPSSGPPLPALDPPRPTSGILAHPSPPRAPGLLRDKPTHARTRITKPSSHYSPLPGPAPTLPAPDPPRRSPPPRPAPTPSIPNPPRLSPPRLSLPRTHPAPDPLLRYPPRPAPTLPAPDPPRRSSPQTRSDSPWLSPPRTRSDVPCPKPAPTLLPPRPAPTLPAPTLPAPTSLSFLLGPHNFRGALASPPPDAPPTLPKALLPAPSAPARVGPQAPHPQPRAARRGTLCRPEVHAGARGQRSWGQGRERKVGTLGPAPPPAALVRVAVTPPARGSDPRPCAPPRFAPGDGGARGYMRKMSNE